MSKFDRERDAVRKLCSILGYAPSAYEDPNSRSVESGGDVKLLFGERAVGLQVTDYHADEGPTPREGSRLRAEEERKARAAMEAPDPVKAYGHWAPAGYIGPLSFRIKDKVEKTAKHDGHSFDEMWLLICAQINGWGASASTMISPDLVRLNDLDEKVSPMLRCSVFSRAFLLLELDGIVFGWDKGENRWCTKR
ncbi:hypothetical protein IYY11_00365 [Methylocystis sp. H62]|uniref:hypothetical protein n=1 Tax=Methylocystis sp. H62 TaxID=2785789 RepID=UPI0018C21323|nr:hypothetical protein [Methylocystis sp. H62]MBG0791965.1 hypothetical protein [Methylocystis sp. H62]